MSAPFIPLPLLSTAEWHEMNALRKAISNGPSMVSPDKQERFAALFTRSLIGKGDRPLK